MYDEKLNSIIKKLMLYYPEKKVFSLDSIDKDLREKVSIYSKENGFEDVNSFLNSIGYEMIKGEEVKKLRPSVIYTPGNEPDSVKNKVINICNRLNEYYPNKEITRGIQNDHKALSKSISGMYQWLGYKDAQEFLEAYGYKYTLQSTTGGRPSGDYYKVIDYLIDKYSNNPIYSSIKELIENESEIAGNLKTINNKSNELFGMTLKSYLEEKNILLKVEKEVVESKPKVEIIDRIRDYLTIELENTNYNLDELLEKYKKFKLEFRAAEKSIYVKDIYEKSCYVEIPYGVTGLSASIFQKLDRTEVIKIPKTVKRVDFNALKKINSLKQIILVNPMFKLKKEYFDGINIIVDYSEAINKYIKVNNIVENDKINLINYINKCYQKLNYNIKNFYLTKDYTLAFTSERKIYDTDIKINDIKYFDDIVEKIFNDSWIVGFIRMYSYYGYYPAVKLDICKGDSNNEN